MQLHFMPTGQVRACCWSTESVGDITRERLPDIWAGTRRRELERRLAADDFSAGCEGCAAELAMEGRPGSHPAYFDDWSARLGAVGLWPARMEFELSNLCNLQCVQCSGANSSSIRIHRERRPPLPMAYGDEFFADLEPFLPHLVDASFVGGEPYMAPQNFRIWDELAATNPGVGCTIVTNATHWNERIERVLEQLSVETIVSLDGITAQTYERVRVGGDFARVLRNLGRFHEHARATGRRLRINFCLMPQTHQDLPDLLLFAEERGIGVNVVAVRNPAEHSLPALPLAELRRVLDGLEARADELSAHLSLNAGTWAAELARCRAWVAGAAGDPAGVRPQLSTSILMFRRAGDGPVDEEMVVAELRGRTGPGVVHRLTVDPTDRIVSCPAAFAVALGVGVADIEDRPTSRLLDFLTRWEVVAETPDRVDSRMTFGGVDFDVVFLAVRDGRGWADEVRLLFAPQPV